MSLGSGDQGNKQSADDLPGHHGGHHFASFMTRYRMSLVVLVMIATWVGCSWLEYLLESSAKDAQITTFPKALWWGIVTFMTVGYGDITPITPWGRVAAGFLMVAGVMATSIITAKISSIFLKDILMEGRRAVDRNKVRDHFIVCGWKDDMDDLLLHFLRLNKALKASDIVVVAERTQEDISALKANPQLADITVIIGPYFQQATLLKAAPQTARKVLILADNTPGSDGKKPNAMEADARTIIAAIALSNIAKGTVVAAEIIDPSLDHHLKLTGVSEIIYSREYSRLMLGSASTGTGLVNVFHDLIDPSSGSTIILKPIPEKFVGRSFAELRSALDVSNQDEMLLGILENTGNPHKIKEWALKEAQKTPSVGTLIDNLHSVKNLRCNRPMFNPPSSYKIPQGSQAIVLVNAARVASVATDPRSLQSFVA